MSLKQPTLLIVVLLLSRAAFAQTVPAKEVTRTVIATAATEEWKGWGLYSEPAPVPDNRLQPREQLTMVKAGKDESRRFEGRIAGLETYEGAEVGLVSMVDVWWINRECYEWAAVEPDGRFSIAAQRFPQALKALCLRAPGHPWTFLRYNFKAGEGGRDIVLQAQPGKRVRISARVAGNPLMASWFRIEPFEAYTSFDDDGGRLTKQRYGYVEAQDSPIYLMLPLQPVALFMRAEGAAHYYAIIDPNTADNFHFELQPEAGIYLDLKRNGKSVSNQPITLVNDWAPLSLIATRTDANGHADCRGLVPGPYYLTVGELSFNLTARPSPVTTIVDLEMKTVTDGFVLGP